MNTLSFPIHLTREDDGGYSVSCPALPGCHSQGDTLDDALANIREAIELTVEDMREHGEPIPDMSRSLQANVMVEV